MGASSRSWASRLAQFVAALDWGAWRIRRCPCPLKQSMSQSTTRCTSLSEHLLQAHSYRTLCSLR